MISLETYNKIAEFFQHLKYIHGADFVNSTLLHHSKLRNALLDFEKTYIIDLEGEISKGV